MTETRTTVREHESELVVVSIERVADAVVALTLTDPDGGALPPWTPGAHVDLELGDLVRQYSLCGDPADSRSYTVAVLRESESRGGSAYIHESLSVGSRVLVRGPRNHFSLDDRRGGGEWCRLAPLVSRPQQVGHGIRGAAGRARRPGHASPR